MPQMYVHATILIACTLDREQQFFDHEQTPTQAMHTS